MAATIFIILFVLIFLGLPIAFCIEFASVGYLLLTNAKPLIIVAQKTMNGMDSFVLLAVPLFTFAGYLMEQGGLSKRLVDWVEKIFGNVTGAMGTITIVCCAIFAALTGSGPATVAAIGAIMMPAMINNGYKKSTAAGLLAAGGALGPIIPPSVAMIVYGSTMNVSIPKMFMGGVLPGIIIVILYITVNYIISKRSGYKTTGTKYSTKEILISTWRSLGVLLLPVVILGGIYGGFFTPTEAATVGVVYSIILGIFYKELTLASFIEAMKKTVITSSTVVLILGISAVFGWVLATERIPVMIANALVPVFGNATTYMIVLMLLLFVVGTLMETLSSIVILAPILVPIGIQLGVDPVHLGVVFCINLVVGFITPPFGVNLFTAVSTTGVSYTEVVKGVFPFMIVAMLAVLIFAFVPQIVLLLPNML